MVSEKEIRDLVSYKYEKEWLEFKQNRYTPETLGEYISALSNSAAYVGQPYGYMIFGVNNVSHAFAGTAFDPDSEVRGEPLKHFLARQLAPENNFSFQELRIDGNRIVVLAIPAAKVAPTSFGGERYIRIGSSKENLRKYPEKESYLFSVLRNGLPTILNTPSRYQNLTFSQLKAYYGSRGLILSEETFRKNLELLTTDDEYNMMAQLLSDDSHMPIRVAIFSGRTKADRMYSVREFGYRCLLYSLDEVLRYGDVLNIIQADERDRIVERKEVPLFENQAFREAIVNAFVHNDWVKGNEPMITVFSDRIEILSRGELPPEQTMEGFFAGRSVPVNPKLSEIFMQLHISEKTGRGIPKIIEAYGKDAFSCGENTITVTIPFRWINEMGAAEKNQGGNVALNISGLTKSQVRILASIRDNPNINRSQLMLELHLSKATVDTAISKLKQLGFIERVGADKNGYYKILKK